MTAPVDPRVGQHRRSVALVTHVDVPHPLERAAAIDAVPIWRRKTERRRLEHEWEEIEMRAADDVRALVDHQESAITHLDAGLARLRDAAPVRIHGKITDERNRLTRTRGLLAESRAVLAQRDFSRVGKLLHDVDRELWAFGGELVVALNQELLTSAYSRELHGRLAANQAQRRTARHSVEEVRRRDGMPEALAASTAAYHLMAEGLELVADALGNQPSAEVAQPRNLRVGAENTVRVIPPQELERLRDVGGLEDVKDLLRRSLGGQLEHREEATRYGVDNVSVLLYGPPGTGKTLLARAVAGEYGLRYLRVTPAVIASPYAHEAARNLARVFDLARQSVPCLLFLDEVDSLGAARAGTPSAEHREIVSQLLSLLEEFRRVPGLLIAGATNAVELLDPAMREGRFDLKVPVPLPDAAGRRDILEVHLRARRDAVERSGLDLDEIAQRLAGRSGAAIAAVVATAAGQAMREKRLIGQEQLLSAIGQGEARDRRQLETPVRWTDVVLPAAVEKRLREILEVVQHPELAAAVGIAAPAGVLLHGPPGTGKTTVAKAIASEVRASFYEISAAQLLSKWVGESEERVVRLFATARENRPSIIFIDEIDALLRRRSGTSSSPWEERLVSQFLGELDGLSSGTGVFLVGATNRIDIVDDAVKERRLIPLELPLPDLAGRRALLDLLFARVRHGSDVDFDELARATGGMSGADLKRLRDEVGIKALNRGLRQDASPKDIVVGAEDLYESLHERRAALIPD